MSLIDLFRTKPSDNIQRGDSSNLGLATAQNTEDRRVGETYNAYGSRMCGLTNASWVSLSAFMQKIYMQEKQSQIKDVAKQQNAQQRIQQELNNIDANIEAENDKLQNENDNVESSRARISDLKQEITQLKSKNGELNRKARTSMIIGMIILLPLTVYLFVFYGSTFYSAFFKDFSTADISLSTAIFDAQAFSHAFDAGVAELILILSAPIIFLGLGYVLHAFSEQEGNAKYLKMAIIVLITFIFDCILAYNIGEKIYNEKIIDVLEETEPYSIKIAITDSTIWAVIFCGFIVYMIWGLVFGWTYNSYNNLRSNDNEIEKINIQIAGEENKIGQYKQNISSINNNLIKLKISRQNAVNRLTNNVFFNPNIIQACLAQFFAGWMAVMPSLGKSTEEQSKARDIFDTNIKTLVQ